MAEPNLDLWPTAVKGDMKVVPLCRLKKPVYGTPQDVADHIAKCPACQEVRLALKKVFP